MGVSAQDVLARHFPGLTPEEVDAELSRTPAAGATPISSAAVRYLIDHGGDEAQVALDQFDEAAVQRDRMLAAARTLQEMVTSSLTIEEAATSLALSRSRISHRLRDQSLYAFTVQGRRCLPHWQFREGAGGGEVIPGLAQIVPAIPQEMHPLGLAAFMTEPLDVLGNESPVQYLCAGGAVEAVVNRLATVGRP